MLYNLLKKVAYVLVALVLLLALLAGLSSYFSLDFSYTHTADSAALPLYSAEVEYPEVTLVTIPANGFEFRARLAGSSSSHGTVILLHGFPVTSAMWAPLLKPLVNAGYRVVAFDQRGYSPGARPHESERYTLPSLVSDVLAIADSLGAEQFHLVGHDWGATVGWTTVLGNPDKIKSWTGISIPHPSAFNDALVNDPDQRSRSRYSQFFNTSLVPEVLLTLNRLSLLMAAYEGMDAKDIEEYRRVFSEPRALSSALNWYRQKAALSEGTLVDENTSVPTLFLWGNQDTVVARASVEGQRQYMLGEYREIELAGDHWLLSSHAQTIAAAILEHIGSNP